MGIVRLLLSIVCFGTMWYIDNLIINSEKDKTKKIGFCVLSLIGCLFALSFIYLFI